jgi:hypothetical protein
MSHSYSSLVSTPPSPPSIEAKFQNYKDFNFEMPRRRLFLVFAFCMDGSEANSLVANRVN